MKIGWDAVFAMASLAAALTDYRLYLAGRVKRSWWPVWVLFALGFGVYAVGAFRT